MNKSGHLAFGLAAGSAYLWVTQDTSSWFDWGMIAVSLCTVAIGSLAPDIDHRTSTASKLITPFSAKTRRMLRRGAISTWIIGAFFFVLSFLAEKSLIAQYFSPKVVASYPLWLGGGILLYTLAILRDLILVGVGAGMLYAYGLYGLHWMFAFTGGALLILPLVRHRGVIHTPEFACCLAIGVASATAASPWYVQAIGQGFVIGWFAHLAGDLFGTEGIESIFARFVPGLRWLRVSFRMFSNGGRGEQRMIRLSWTVSFFIWGAMLFQWDPEKAYHQIGKFLM